MSYGVRALSLVCLAGVLLLAADAPWKTKPSAQWTEEDSRQVLTGSPWAREITAGVSRRLDEDELRDAGKMGQPRGIGYDGVDPKSAQPKLPADIVANSKRSVRSTVQAITLRLRWESALPVRIAEFRSGEVGLPTLEGDGYRIAIFGIPGGPFKGDPKQIGDPLKKDAVLRRAGKRDVKPSSVEAFPGADGWAIVYVFPLSAEITPKDGRVEFEAHIGRIVVVQSFELAGMTFLSKLEL